ncbi:hypothetical protein J1614_000490 [Plenodomus biglobosus]|nr:hypothetical protein J1614_000490 [Plenodomus biglobosus]
MADAVRQVPRCTFTACRNSAELACNGLGCCFRFPALEMAEGKAKVHIGSRTDNSISAKGEMLGLIAREDVTTVRHFSSV